MYIFIVEKFNIYYYSIILNKLLFIQSSKKKRNILLFDFLINQLEVQFVSNLLIK